MKHIIFTALLVALLVLVFAGTAHAQSEDTPSPGFTLDDWQLLDPPTSRASFGYEDSGTLSLGYGTGPARFETFADYRKFDHTAVGFTFEAFLAIRFWNNSPYSEEHDNTAVFASPRLTTTFDPDTGAVGGEAALRLGFVGIRSQEMESWGWFAAELVKVTNAQWEFRYRAEGWVPLEDWLWGSMVFQMRVYEGTMGPGGSAADGLIGARLRLPVDMGVSVTLGTDWVVAPQAIETWMGARMEWFLAVEWRG